jgi:hypothetical protein
MANIRQADPLFKEVALMAVILQDNWRFAKSAIPSGAMAGQTIGFVLRGESTTPAGVGTTT